MFENHANYVLDNYLNQWANIVLSKVKSPISKKDNDPIAVIVEDRPSKLLRFSILNTILMGRLNLPVRLYTNTSKINFLKDILLDMGEWLEVIDIESVGVNYIDKRSYNELLKSTRFWDSFPNDKVLIFQTDSLLIEPLEFEMFKYDYIGAPWSRNKFTTGFPVFRKDLTKEKGVFWSISEFNTEIDMSLLIGNGGLSIRNRNLMSNICASEEQIIGEPEDIYFSRMLLTKNVDLPSLNVARRFSCEAEHYTSIGSHKSHIYLKGEMQAEIYERHIKNVLGLISASLE